MESHILPQKELVMTELKKKINYTVVCVNEFAERYKISERDAFFYLLDYQGI